MDGTFSTKLILRSEDQSEVEDNNGAKPFISIFQHCT